MRRFLTVVLFAVFVVIIPGFYGCVPKRASTPLTEEEAHFADADKDLSENRFNEALYKFEKFLSKYPQSKRISDAYYRVGYTSVVIEKYDRAREAFSYYSDNFPDGQYKAVVDAWVSVLKRLMPKKMTEDKKLSKKEITDISTEKSLEECREENLQLKGRITKLESIIQGSSH